MRSWAARGFPLRLKRKSEWDDPEVHRRAHAALDPAQGSQHHPPFTRERAEREYEAVVEMLDKDDE